MDRRSGGVAAEQAYGDAVQRFDEFRQAEVEVVGVAGDAPGGQRPARLDQMVGERVPAVGRGEGDRQRCGQLQNDEDKKEDAETGAGVRTRNQRPNVAPRTAQPAKAEDQRSNDKRPQRAALEQTGQPERQRRRAEQRQTEQAAETDSARRGPPPPVPARRDARSGRRRRARHPARPAAPARRPAHRARGQPQREGSRRVAACDRRNRRPAPSAPSSTAPSGRHTGARSEWVVGSGVFVGMKSS